MRVLDRLDGARKLVLDGVAHAPQQADPGVAGVGEHHLLRHPHADHLVVDDVGGHADESQVLDPLADRFMRGGMRDEVGEALEGDGVAVEEIARHRLLEAKEFGHERDFH